MLLVFVCIEALGSCIVNCVEFGNDVIYSSYSSYNDFVGSLRPLTDEIVESDNSFFRYEKNVHRKYCDNMALNIRGLTNSTSTLNKKTIDFLANLGYASKSHWSKYLGGNLINDSLLGIKYTVKGIEPCTSIMNINITILHCLLFIKCQEKLLI